jgi:hypothetical protein
VCSFLVILSAAQPAYACKAYYASDLSYGDNIVQDFNDFAYIYESAGDPYCAGAAAVKLNTKLSNTSTSVWQNKWLSGGSVSFIMASGLFLGMFGELSPALDQKIRDVANAYSFDVQRDGSGNVTCGFAGYKWLTGNTCLEDYAIGAGAHGWRAAYYRNTGRSEWSVARSESIGLISDMLDPTTSCIRKLDPNATKDPANRGVCNGTYADLTAVPPTGELVTLNHGEQSIAYGIGQMTAFAVAAVGMDVADKPFVKTELGADRVAMAGFLYAEGRSRATAVGSTDAVFSATGCYWLDGPNTNLVAGQPCYDTQLYTANHPSLIGGTPYRADMFAIKATYTRFGLPMPGTGGYTYDRFKDIYLTASGDQDKIWGIARKYYYGMAWGINTKPTMQGRTEYAGGIKRGAYFTTAGTNGASVTLGATSRSTSTPNAASMTVMDNNYGTLRNGDPIAIKNLNGWYWNATNGGGSTVTTVSTNPTALTIVKISNTSEMIAGGDQIAIRTATGHYLSAPTYTGTVTATATTIGTNEKFTLDRTKFD